MPIKGEKVAGVLCSGSVPRTLLLTSEPLSSSFLLHLVRPPPRRAAQRAHCCPPGAPLHNEDGVPASLHRFKLGSFRTSLANACPFSPHLCTRHIRSRITVVCAECKRLKLKCDRRTPCS